MDRVRDTKMETSALQANIKQQEAEQNQYEFRNKFILD